MASTLSFATDESWRDHVDEARAVIGEMREPTKEMVESAWADALAEDAAGVWRAMIEAALAHGEQAPGKEGQDG